MLTDYRKVKPVRGFASKAEAELYDLLCLMEKGKEISDIQCQDHVHLSDAKILYIADFKYKNLKNGEWEWAEMKGFETEKWRLKRRLWMHYGPGKLVVYKKGHRGPFVFEELVPKNGQCSMKLGGK